MNIPIMIIVYPCLVVHIPHALVLQNQTNHNLLNIPHVLYFWVCHHVLLFHIQTKKEHISSPTDTFSSAQKPRNSQSISKHDIYQPLIKLDHM